MSDVKSANVNPSWLLLSLMEYRRIAIYTLLCVVVLLAHIFVAELPADVCCRINKTTEAMLVILCTGGALFLWTHAKNNRNSMLFAVTMLLMAISSGWEIVSNMLNLPVFGNSAHSLLYGNLVYGTLYAYIMLLYPQESMYPQPFTFQKALPLLLPIAAIGCCFAFVHDTDNIAIRNRIICTLALIYQAYLLSVMLHCRRYYRNQCTEQCSSSQMRSMCWYDDYIAGCFILFISYLNIISYNTPQTTMLHYTLFLFFFAYGFYNVAYSQKPDNDTETAASPMEPSPIASSMNTASVMTDFSFKGKINEYKIQLETWMETEKPYTNKDFRLTDIMQVLPLNRSYLSVLFRDGYGQSFYKYIMAYRIAESKRLLSGHSKLTISAIASLSGFSSPSVFGRAFLQAEGCTPKQWRETIGQVHKIG